MKKLLLFSLLILTLIACGHRAYGPRTEYYPPSPELAPPPPPPMPLSYNYLESEEYASIKENGFQDVRSHPLSTFSIDVDAASYSNVRRFINDGQLPPVDAVRIEELINYFDYDYPQPYDGTPFSIVTELSICPWNRSHRLLHIGLQGKEVITDEMPPSNLVFLLDVSGSMADADKLPLVKSAFRLLVEQLRPEDRVAIVTYASDTGVKLHSTNGANKERIIRAIDDLRAGGTTAGGEGIKLAYNMADANYIEGGNNRVILATDGDFNVGITDNAQLEELIVRERQRGIFLSMIGVGEENIKDNRMEMLADKGNGNYNYIDNMLEAEKVFKSEMSGTLLTIAKDVKIQIEFNPARARAYRLIGYENRLMADKDFKNDRKDAGDMGAGHSVTALYEIIPSDSDEDFAEVDPLKYQQRALDNVAERSRELLTLKIRYKMPDDEESRQLTFPVSDEGGEHAETTNDFRFSAAVAEFGMLLRDSDYKKRVSFDDVLQLASQSKGDDEMGYRAEFIRLVSVAKSLR